MPAIARHAANWTAILFGVTAAVVAAMLFAGAT